MITEEREHIIMRLLEARGVVSIKHLASACPDVSTVTLRRDLARLETQSRLRRTHGGAVRLEHRAGLRQAEAAMPANDDHGTIQRNFDALILPPVAGRSANTLRQQAASRRIPFLAESAPQTGGIYLGPRNFSGSQELGRVAGRHHGAKSSAAEILIVSLEPLSNARERADGFVDGFRRAFAGEVVVHRVDGRGMLKEALRQTRDALRAHPGIDVVFGVNDHTILGALDVAQAMGRADIDGYSVGGEGGSLFDELARDKALRATLALFPEVVGHLAIDTICRCFAGQDAGDAVITPACVLTPRSLPDFYRRDAEQWRLRPEVLARMCADQLYEGPALRGRTISFMLHYPSHEWYRNLAAAMRLRCAELGVDLVVRNAEDEVAEQIQTNRRDVAAAAAREIAAREIVLIDGGEASRFLAEALRGTARDQTVITNSLRVVDILAGVADLKIMMTGGEFQSATRSLVGPGVGALLETMRADKAFVSPDGVSPTFGLSFEDERAALVCRRFADTAREVVVLADHSVVGLESNVQAVRPSHAHTVFTDAGTLTSHRRDLSAAGMRVIVADPDEPAADQRSGLAARTETNKVQ